MRSGGILRPCVALPFSQIQKAECKGVATAFGSYSGGSMVSGAHGTSGGSRRTGGNSEDVGRLFAGRRIVSTAVLAVRAGIFAGGLCDGRNNNYQTYT